MVIKEIINRRSVREYAPKIVSDDDILEIIKAGQFAPSAHHNMVVEFIIIRAQETKDKIFEICREFQDFVKKAPVLIILVTDKKKSVLTVQDLSVVSENMFLQATALGLGTVWKNLQPDWAKKILAFLNVPKNYIAINMIPVGYPAKKTEPHIDKDFGSEKIHQEKW
jgi:nitroreductase